MDRGYFKELIAFYLVVSRESFAIAARELGICRRSCCGYINRLEERLGVVLLRNRRDGVHLTRIGEKLVKAVGPGFIVLEEVQEDLWGR